MRYYKLANDAENGLGFYYGVENGAIFNLGATGRDYRKAYLVLPEGVAGAGVRIVLDKDEEATAIHDLNEKGGRCQPTRDGWFTLDGRHLNGQPTMKGIYIRNGRKVNLSHIP